MISIRLGQGGRNNEDGFVEEEDDRGRQLSVPPAIMSPYNLRHRSRSPTPTIEITEYEDNVPTGRRGSRGASPTPSITITEDCSSIIIHTGNPTSNSAHELALPSSGNQGGLRRRSVTISATDSEEGGCTNITYVDTEVCTACDEDVFSSDNNCKVCRTPSLGAQYVTNVEIICTPIPIHDPFQLLPLKQSFEKDQQPSNKRLRRFYKKQNELIDELVLPAETGPEEDQALKRKVRIAIYGSLIVNVILLCLKVVAAIKSGSMAIFATTADSAMDLVSMVIMIGAKKFSKGEQQYLYPIGKSRFETVGLLIYGTLMSTVSVQLIITSIQSRLLDPELEPPELDVISISLIGVVIVTKVALYIFCRRIPAQSVRVVSNDHRNDTLLNSVGLLTAVLADKLNYPKIDPIGAILVALITFTAWVSVVMEQGKLISGRVAEPSLVSRLTYVAMVHDPQKIHQVGSCKAYHAGGKVIVEMEVTVAPGMPLKEARDLEESLRERLESIRGIERAFVQCDYPRQNDTTMISDEEDNNNCRL